MIKTFSNNVNHHVVVAWRQQSDRVIMNQNVSEAAR